MQVTIQQENESDSKDVYELNKTAFGQETEAKLVELLRKSNAFIPELSLVAMADGNKVVGYILFTRIKIVADNENSFDSLALAPMAVRSELQGQGIGGKLIHHGLNKARELGYHSVIVLGHEHYYPRFGFVEASTWNIRCPYNVPSNVFMAIELEKDGLKNVSGVVQYAKEFDEI